MHRAPTCWDELHNSPNRHTNDILVSSRCSARSQESACPVSHAVSNAMEATHIIINHLRSRARGAAQEQRLGISPAAIRCLRQHWSTAQTAGVTFHPDSIVVEGVEFRLM